MGLKPTNLQTPPNNNLKLYRYMDCASFASLITKKRLIFTRIDQFIDKREGQIPKQIKLFYDQLIDQYIKRSTKEEEKKNLITFKNETWPNLIKNDYPKTIYASCWTDKEDDISLWDRYCGLDKKYGICIQTTREKLIDIFKNKEEAITDGKVVYISQEANIEEINKAPFRPRSTNTLPSSQQFALIKRNAFASESEHRLMIDTIARGTETTSQDLFEEARNIKNIVYKNTNVIKQIYIENIEKNLIEKVTISPYCKDSWYLEVIKSLLPEGLKDTTNISTLLREPE